MRKKVLNFKRYSISKAKKAMLRIQEFITTNKYKIQPYFILPYFRPKNIIKNPTKYKHCPYCGSKLKETDNGTICSGNKLRNIWNEIRFLSSIYGDKTPYFLTTRLYRFYEMFMKQGRLKCGYVFGNEEKKYKKGPLY